MKKYKIKNQPTNNSNKIKIKIIIKNRINVKFIRSVL